MELHRTNARMIREDAKEWEFTCDKCSYLAIYTVHFPWRDCFVLKTIDYGDLQAIHLNDVLRCRKAGEPPNDDESWLTPELRKQIEDIIDKFDWE
jgi:hypothetical protein